MTERSHKRWTSADDALMARMFLDGYTLDDIAEALGRTRLAVKGHIHERCRDESSRQGEWVEIEDVMRELLDDLGEDRLNFKPILKVDIETGMVLENRLEEVLESGPETVRRLQNA